MAFTYCEFLCKCFINPCKVAECSVYAIVELFMQRYWGLIPREGSLRTSATLGTSSLVLSEVGKLLRVLSRRRSRSLDTGLPTDRVLHDATKCKGLRVLVSTTAVARSEACCRLTAAYADSF